MLFTLIGLTLPLCFDSFLIAAAVGINRPPARTRLRLALLLAAFEAGMPLVGLLTGHALAAGLGDVAQYVAIALLIGAGSYMALHARDEDASAQKLAGLHGFAALALAFSISLDGLAIGFTYGLLKLPVLLVTILIAFQAFVLMQLGFVVGSRLPDQIRHWGEKLANWILVVIGLVLLGRKLLGS